jgi:hypothetical protein
MQTANDRRSWGEKEPTWRRRFPPIVVHRLAQAGRLRVPQCDRL